MSNDAMAVGSSEFELRHKDVVARDRQEQRTERERAERRQADLDDILGRADPAGRVDRDHAQTVRARRAAIAPSSGRPSVSPANHRAVTSPRR